MFKAIHQHRTQYIAFGILSAGAMLMAIGLVLTSQSPYQEYFGDVNALLVFALAIVLGVFLWSLLIPASSFRIISTNVKEGISRAAGFAILMAIPIILVDSNVPFPESINVLFPESLLFYPSIGLVVEILFHLLPLSLLYWILTRLHKQSRHQRITWIFIFLVSLIEPTYQTVFSEGSDPSWKVIYVFCHIWVFNLIGLNMFRRYGFVTMYALRFFYYVLWHILWGTMRLDILF